MVEPGQFGLLEDTFVLAKVPTPNRPANWNAQVKYVGRIPVEDASGCRFELHEFRAWRLLSPTIVFRLDTGEAVNRVDANTFVIISTGEGLVRVIEVA